MSCWPQILTKVTKYAIQMGHNLSSQCTKCNMYIYLITQHTWRSLSSIANHAAVEQATVYIPFWLVALLGQPGHTGMPSDQWASTFRSPKDHAVTKDPVDHDWQTNTGHWTVCVLAGDLWWFHLPEWRTTCNWLSNVFYDNIMI